MTLELRSAQQRVVDDVAAAFRAGHKRVMVSAACGFGKTELATAMLLATRDHGKRGSFVCDRKSLVSQTSERFDKYGLSHGVLMSDHWRFRPSEQIQVCSVQTIRRRQWPQMQLVVVDEAHVLHPEVKAKLDAKDCYAIGLSATPVTSGLGKYFDTVVNAPPTNRLIEQGLLVPLRIFSCAEPDMTGVRVEKGEFEKAETEKRALQVVGDVVAEYLKHGGNKKFIGFGASIAHCQELQRQFLANGINVALYTTDEKDEDRDEVVREFRKPDSAIRGILSVEALTRGFDVADVEVLILARPLRSSLALHVQMLGRVMRTAEGKVSAIVLDHSGNCARFWLEQNELFEIGVRQLDDGKRKKKTKERPREEEQARKCPTCRSLHRPAPFCPSCGHEYPTQLAVEHVPGTLKELIAAGDPGLMRKQLWPQVCWIVKYQRSPRDDVHAQRMAQAMYFELVGHTAHARFDSTRPVEPTREVAGKVQANRIRWAHGHGKSNPKQQAQAELAGAAA
jgi:DNA repair protein RadD